MIRKNWSPGGGDKSLRGRDRWVRISWDQALDIVASETRRITGKYGQDALWLTGKPSDNPHYHNMFGVAGGFTTDWGTLSTGAWEETRSEEHTSELQSLMRITYAVFGLKKKKQN